MNHNMLREEALYLDKTGGDFIFFGGGGGGGGEKNAEGVRPSRGSGGMHPKENFEIESP